MPFKFVKSFLSILIITLFASFSLNAFANQRNSQLLEMADNVKSGKYVKKHFLELLKKPFSADAKKKALIIGDSHAQDFVNMIFENKRLQDYQIRTRDIPTQCQPILGNNASKYIAAKDKAFCAKADSLAKAKDQIAEADLIILAANWKEWSAKELANTIKKMQLSPKQKLLVLGRKSFGKISIRNYLRLSDQELRNLRNKADNAQGNINRIMKSTLDKSVFIDTQRLVCGSTNTCRVFTSDLKLISFDGGHLTKDGARYMGNILFKDSHLRNL